MEIAIIVAGISAEVFGWWLVASGRADIWKVMPVVLGSMGAAAVIVRPPVAGPGTGVATAALAGLAAGLVLYLATRAFVWVASHWGPFRHDMLETYGRASHGPDGRALRMTGVIKEVTERKHQESARLKAEKQLEIVPGATHLFEEPGALERVSGLASAWFLRHLAPS